MENDFPTAGRKAPTDFDIHPLISHRWSPRAIADRLVEPEKLKRCLEAARWAPSSRNEQPWRFLVATRDEPEWLEKLGSYLVEGNSWARKSPVLVASAYRTTFTRNDKPNASAARDLGAAEENMFLQAFACGLAMHQMAGFERARLEEELLPDGFAAGAMSAIFYLADVAEVSEEQRAAESAARKRKPLSEFVFGAEWGTPHPIL